MITRQELDLGYTGCIQAPSSYRKDGDDLLVNGAQWKYKLWVDANDKSLTPCLTGEVGGMPGAWENWVTAWHLNNLPEYGNYIDIGANVGYFAFLAGSLGRNVLAIEANPRYVELLMRSADENDTHNVTILNAAVTDRDGEEITLNIPTELHGSASIYDIPTHETTSIRVPTVNLDAIDGPREGSKTLIKMDVEGAEEAVFAGATEFNRKYRPTYIMEYTPGMYSNKFVDALESYGRLTVVDNNGGETTLLQGMNGTEDWVTLVVRPHYA